VHCAPAVGNKGTPEGIAAKDKEFRKSLETIWSYRMLLSYWVELATSLCSNSTTQPFEEQSWIFHVQDYTSSRPYHHTYVLHRRPCCNVVDRTYWRRWPVSLPLQQLIESSFRLNRRILLTTWPNRMCVDVSHEDNKVTKTRGYRCTIQYQSGRVKLTTLQRLSLVPFRPTPHQYGRIPLFAKKLLL